MFRDPAVAHACGIGRSGARRPDHGGRADPRGSRGGREAPRTDRARSQEGNDAELRREQDVLFRCRTALEDGRPLRALDLPADDARRLRGFQFLSAKPLLLVLNLDEADLPDADDAVALARSESFVSGAATRAVPICARIELEIAQLDPADAAAFMADLGLHESGLDRVIRASYDLLGYISFFTVGEDESRAWSIPRGTPAQDRRRGNPQRHPARVHPRGGRALRAAARARHAGRLPRTRRAAPRRQGVRRPGRRRDQLPPRDVVVPGMMTATTETGEAPR